MNAVVVFMLMSILSNRAGRVTLYRERDKDIRMRCCEMFLLELVTHCNVVNVVKSNTIGLKYAT
jgi:hypothetical protein